MVTVVYDPPALAEIRRAPSWWGIPLLFPFPGSMPGGTYEFEGRTLRLGRPEQPVVNEPTYLGPNRPPNARRDYHGFVMDLPWQVAETRATDDAATVRSTLDSADFPEEHTGFPFPYRVEATYRLDAHGLRLDFRTLNTGDGRLPFGFGAHPFVRLPLGPDGAPENCLLSVPAARRWGRSLRSVLDDRSLPLPPQDEITPPVSADLDLRTPKPFVERVYNGMYTDLALRDGCVEAFVRDPANGVEAVMRATPNLPNVVFWSPPGRPDVCFEPWSCPSNVFNLAARGVPGSGLVVLDPGQSWEASMWLSLRPTA
jgi:aldose 1-epimerase